MDETPAELRSLQELLDRSIARANPHLTGIIEPGRRTISAERLCHDLVNVCVLNVATVTAKGEPRLSAVDGHFRHGRWHFTTSGSAAKAVHLSARPGISVSYTPREGFGVWTHGRASVLARGSAEQADLDEYLTVVYDQSPSEWGPDIIYVAVQPDWMVGFAMTPDEEIEVAAVATRRAARLAAAGKPTGADA